MNNSKNAHSADILGDIHSRFEQDRNRLALVVFGGLVLYETYFVFGVSYPSYVLVWLNYLFYALFAGLFVTTAWKGYSHLSGYLFFYGTLALILVFEYTQFYFNEISLEYYDQVMPHLTYDLCGMVIVSAALIGGWPALKGGMATLAIVVGYCLWGNPAVMLRPNMLFCLILIGIVMISVYFLDRIFQQSMSSLEGVTRRLREQVDVKTEEYSRERFQAREAIEKKNTLLANVSHDLRTPLSSIIGYARILRDRVGSTGPREVVDHIRDRATKLDQLIQRMIEQARDDAGQFTGEGESS